MHPPSTPEAGELFDRIRDELSIGQTKAMKEDLLAAREIGGLLGQVVCVRKAEPPAEVLQYARHNSIEVLAKTNLVNGWRSLLHPGQKPSLEQLQALTKTSTAAKA